MTCSCLPHAPASWWGNIGAEIKIGGLRATMKLLSSIQAQVIQSLVTFQHSSGDSFPVESLRSEDRKRRNEAPEKIQVTECRSLSGGDPWGVSPRARVWFEGLTGWMGVSACPTLSPLQRCRNPEAVQSFTQTNSPLGLVVSLHLLMIIRYSLKLTLVVNSSV